GSSSGDPDNSHENAGSLAPNIAKRVASRMRFMTQKQIVGIGITAAFLFSGCANHLRPPLKPNDAYVARLKAKYENAASYDIYSLQANTTKGRNKVMNELMFLVNDYYDRYELRWYSTT